LKAALFTTGDKTLNEMLEDARRKILSPKIGVRKEALEGIWDAFERLKTIENPKGKKSSVAQLLPKAVTGPELRDRVNKEMNELTEIGQQLHHDPAHGGRQATDRRSDPNRLFISADVLVDAAAAESDGARRLGRTHGAVRRSGRPPAPEAARPGYSGGTIRPRAAGPPRSGRPCALDPLGQNPCVNVQNPQTNGVDWLRLYGDRSSR
jgi:hypothetical protein